MARPTVAVLPSRRAVGGVASRPALSVTATTAHSPAVVVRGGPQGRPGETGPAPVAQTFQILGVSSFNAVHGLAYVPAVRITDATGAEVDVDLLHSPGQVTAMFPGPFTGLLTLG